MEEVFLSRLSISVLVCVRCFAMSHAVNLLAVPLAQSVWAGGEALFMLPKRNPVLVLAKPLFKGL